MTSTKRRRSATPESLPKERRIKREKQMDDDDDGDNVDSAPWWMRPDPVKPGVPSSSPAPVSASMTTKQPSPTKWPYRRRPKVKQEETTTQDISSAPQLPSKQCKFAKAGCPFAGTPEQVAQHETTYCAPLYTQLAHFKMLAAAPRPSPPSPKKVDLPPLPSTSSNRSFRLSSPQKDVPMDQGTTSASQPDSTISTEALQHQIQRLQSDLRKAQKQLEDEKNLRTGRLRKAAERCLALMSLSEAGEGKAENLRMKLAAERNLREKLEEEVEYLRVAAAQSQREASYQ